MKINPGPLAIVRYVCNTCHTSKHRFGVYSSYSQTATFCWKCKMITKHGIILPSDDNEKYYKRPSY